MADPPWVGAESDRQGVTARLESGGVRKRSSVLAARGHPHSDKFSVRPTTSSRQQPGGSEEGAGAGTRRWGHAGSTRGSGWHSDGAS